MTLSLIICLVIIALLSLIGGYILRDETDSIEYLKLFADSLFIKPSKKLKRSGLKMKSTMIYVLGNLHERLQGFLKLLRFKVLVFCNSSSIIFKSFVTSMVSPILTLSTALILGAPLNFCLKLHSDLKSCKRVLIKPVNELICLQNGKLKSTWTCLIEFLRVCGNHMVTNVRMMLSPVKVFGNISSFILSIWKVNLNRVTSLSEVVVNLSEAVFQAFIISFRVSLSSEAYPPSSGVA